MMDQTVNPIKTRKDINTLSKETKKKGDQDALSPEGMLLPEQVLKPIEGMQDKKETTREVVPDRFKQVRDKIIEETKRQEMDDAENKTAKTKEEIPGETTDIQTQESALDGRYTTFADLADAKASEYMTAAQEFLKEGKYYKAADSFALAAVWKPQDAQTWIGQVGSLFAAGEYMSSAYYLGQVLALKPELIEQKIPSAILMQNRDIFENGIIETAAWQERSQSGELAFLMAYMLWQDGKVVRAQDAIARAQTLIPESEAIKTLVGIINSSVPAQKPAAGAGTAKEPNSLSAQVNVPKTIFREPNQP
jgi:tetratricopeptide (TPR) repeat protein